MIESSQECRCSPEQVFSSWSRRWCEEVPHLKNWKREFYHQILLPPSILLMFTSANVRTPHRIEWVWKKKKGVLTSRSLKLVWSRLHGKRQWQHSSSHSSFRKHTDYNGDDDEYKNVRLKAKERKTAANVISTVRESDRTGTLTWRESVAEGFTTWETKTLCSELLIPS